MTGAHSSTKGVSRSNSPAKAMSATPSTSSKPNPKVTGSSPIAPISTSTPSKGKKKKKARSASRSKSRVRSPAKRDALRSLPPQPNPKDNASDSEESGRDVLAFDSDFSDYNLSGDEANNETTARATPRWGDEDEENERALTVKPRKKRAVSRMRSPKKVRDQKVKEEEKKKEATVEMKTDSSDDGRVKVTLSSTEEKDSKEGIKQDVAETVNILKDAAIKKEEDVGEGALMLTIGHTNVKVGPRDSDQINIAVEPANISPVEMYFLPFIKHYKFNANNTIIGEFNRLAQSIKWNLLERRRQKKILCEAVLAEFKQFNVAKAEEHGLKGGLAEWHAMCIELGVDKSAVKGARFGSKLKCKQYVRSELIVIFDLIDARRKKTAIQRFKSNAAMSYHIRKKGKAFVKDVAKQDETLKAFLRIM